MLADSTKTGIVEANEWILLFIWDTPFLFIIESEIWTDSEQDEYICDDREESDEESPPGPENVEMCAAALASKPLTNWLIGFFLMLQAHFHLAD